jgi:acetoin utilization deacetylase AcuC-like enzyme
MSVTIIVNSRHAAHDQPRHVERAARLSVALEALHAAPCASELAFIEAQPADDASIRAVHAGTLLDRVRWSAAQAGFWIDHDTYTTAASHDAARCGAGAAIQAVESIAGSALQRSFALVRPPGHHATATRSMGFCLFNNVAIAAQHARARLGVGRIAIVDIDVHHGNGTQDIFYQQPDVLFCSIHAAPLYPGTGDDRETGSGPGSGATLNIPVPHGTGDAGAALAFTHLIEPALRRFQPELILVSAGFDGHHRDPLGPLTYSVAGYAAMVGRLRAIADECCGGRIALVLEGGYDLAALAACVVGTTRALAGHHGIDDPLGPSGQREPDITPIIARITARHPLFTTGTTP